MESITIFAAPETFVEELLPSQTSQEPTPPPGYLAPTHRFNKSAAKRKRDHETTHKKAENRNISQVEKTESTNTFVEGRPLSQASQEPTSPPGALVPTHRSSNFAAKRKRDHADSDGQGDTDKKVRGGTQKKTENKNMSQVEETKSITTLTTPETLVEEIPPSQASQESTSPTETEAGPLAPTHRSSKSAAKRNRNHAVSDGQGGTNKRGGTQIKSPSRDSQEQQHEKQEQQDMSIVEDVVTSEVEAPPPTPENEAGPLAPTHCSSKSATKPVSDGQGVSDKKTRGVTLKKTEKRNVSQVEEMESITTLATPEAFVEEINPSRASQKQPQEQEQQDISIVTSEAEAPTPTPETEAGLLAPTHCSSKAVAKRKRDHVVSDGQGGADKKPRGETLKKNEKRNVSQVEKMGSITTLATPEAFVEEINPSRTSQKQPQEQEQQDISIVTSEAEAPTPTPETEAELLAPTHCSSKAVAKRKRDHVVSDGQGGADKKPRGETLKKSTTTLATPEAFVEEILPSRVSQEQQHEEQEQQDMSIVEDVVTREADKRKEVQGIDSSREERDENKKQAASSRRAKSVPANSYYTFTVVGDTQKERFDNIAKVINISPMKRPLSAISPLITNEHVQDHDGDFTGKDSDETPNVPPPQNKSVDFKGIRDILFFNTEFLGGCFTVRNRPVKQEDVTLEGVYLKKMYDGLLDIGKKISHERYSKLTSKLKMNLHIKSWYCVRPFYETGCVPPTDFTDKGISSYRIFNDDTGLFQFDSDHTSSTPANSAEVFGVMHKCMCVQIKGEMVQKILEKKKNNVIDSFGDIIYRSKWRNDDKRASKCFKFNTTGGNKLSDQDILSIVNTPNMFVATHFNDDTREYGVARSKNKIVPSSIVIYNTGLPPKEGEEEQRMNLKPIPVQFTAITQSVFSREKVKDGMNSIKASNNRRANNVTATATTRSTSLSFDTVYSTLFTFSDMPRELLQHIASQERVKFLKAVKNPKSRKEIVEEEVIEGGEQQERQQQESFRGVIKTFNSVKGINLANRKTGKLVPADNTRIQSVLAGMKDMELEFDIERVCKTPSTQ